MKMRTEFKTIISTLFLFCVCAGGLQAQEYALEILPDKKVIYVDKLGLSQNTSVKDMLLMIPELISRGGVSEFENFAIQLDGKETFAGRDVVLTQTRLGEVEKVEITATPSADQQKDGQGGVINIVPKKLEEDFHGNAFVGASTEWDLMPSVNLYYKKGKLELRGNLDMEYYSPTAEKYSEEKTAGKVIHVADSLRDNYCQETAKFNLKYDFNDSDQIKLWIMESWQVNRMRDFQSKTTTTTLLSTPSSSTQRVDYEEGTDTERSSGMMAVVMSEYEHKFNDGGKFKLSGNYQYNDNKDEKIGEDYTYWTRNPVSVNAEIKQEQPLFKSGNQFLKMDIGYNTSYSKTDATFSQSSNFYSSPFVTFKYDIGGLTFRAGARYQFYRRQYASERSDPFGNDDHDVTADVSLLWQVVPHHVLRLTVNRGLMRPADNMFYPNHVMDRRTGKWVVGNPGLRNAHLHNAELNYVYDWAENGHYLVVNACAGYDRVDDVIEEKIVENGASGDHYYGFGPLFYTTFENTGSNNIVKTNVALFYSKGIFSLSFAGNLFCNFKQGESGIDRYNYYNLSLSPIFNFRHQWVLSSRMLYNSYVEKKDTYLGDCFYMQISVHKTIGHWTLHGEISDVFDYTTIDWTQTATRTCITSYDMYRRYFALGFSYNF